MHALYRLWHSACLSEEGEVIIFGGCSNNILAGEFSVRVDFLNLLFNRVEPNWTFLNTYFEFSDEIHVQSSLTSKARQLGGECAYL